MAGIPRKWSKPKLAKVYEAFSAVAAGRVAFAGDHSANVSSSDGSKKYVVNWNEDLDAYGSNDNASHFVGYIGYPVIAVLIEQGKISVDRELIAGLKNTNWSALNKKHKRDYDAAVDEALDQYEESDKGLLRAAAQRVFDDLLALEIGRVNALARPPR